MSVESILRDRLQAIDDAQTSVEWTEIVDRLSEEIVLVRRQRSRVRSNLLAFLAAVLVVVALGALSLMFRSTEIPPAQSVVTTTVPSTVAPPEEARVRRGEDYTIGEPVAVSSFGRLTWTTLEGDEDSLPYGQIRVHPEGDFWADDYTNPDRVWRSDDGLTWTYTDGAKKPPIPVRPGGEWSYDADDWQVLSRQTEQGTVRIDARDLSSVPISVGGLVPPTDGIPGQPTSNNSHAFVESDGLLLISGTTTLTIPWADLYGTMEEECDVDGVSMTCFFTPDTQWSTNSESFIVRSGSGGFLGTLAMEVVGTDILFSDGDTGQLVHRVTAETPDLAAVIASELARTNGSAVSFDALWIADSSGQVQSVRTPWHQAARIYPLPDGGFAAFPGLDNNGCCGNPETIHIWISKDGLEWTDTGLLPFDTIGATGMYVADHVTRLIVNVNFHGHEVWATPDGINWKQVPKQLPQEARNVQVTSKGLGATTPLSEASTSGVWVTADEGDTWEYVGAASDLASWVFGRESSGTGYSFTGDSIFVTIHSVGRRAIVVGQFDN